MVILGATSHSTSPVYARVLGDLVPDTRACDSRVDLRRRLPWI